MPNTTTRLGIRKPLDSELVTRQSFVDTYTDIDAFVASRGSIGGAGENFLANPSFEFASQPYTTGLTYWNSTGAGNFMFWDGWQADRDAQASVLTGRIETAIIDTISGAGSLGGGARSGRLDYTQSTGNGYLIQSLPPPLCTSLGGHAISGAIRVRGGASLVGKARLFLSVNGVVQHAYDSQVLAAADTWQTFSFENYIPPNPCTTIVFGVQLEASGTFYVDNAMLVPTDRLPPKMPLRPHAQELMLAHQYCEVWGAREYSQEWDSIVAGGIWTEPSRDVRFFVPFRVRKFKVPVVELMDAALIIKPAGATNPLADSVGINGFSFTMTMPSNTDLSLLLYGAWFRAMTWF